MPVFISYRHSERLDAFIINERLLLEGIATHLEPFDASAQQHPDDICTGLCRHITDATHLIAVVSPVTAADWWLPWQLGAATALHRRITLYQSGSGCLPCYQKKWPRMHHREHIELFVRAYLDEGTFCRAMVAGQRSAPAINRSNADFFHADLRAKIRRGF